MFKQSDSNPFYEEEWDEGGNNDSSINDSTKFALIRFHYCCSNCSQ